MWCLAAALQGGGFPELHHFSLKPVLMLRGCCLHPWRGPWEALLNAFIRKWKPKRGFFFSFSDVCEMCMEKVFRAQHNSHRTRDKNQKDTSAYLGPLQSLWKGRKRAMGVLVPFLFPQRKGKEHPCMATKSFLLPQQRNSASWLPWTGTYQYP